MSDLYAILTTAHGCPQPGTRWLIADLPSLPKTDQDRLREARDKISTIPS
jgi:hypothetical protein